jgi:3-oxoacyl-[acyl-carrier-protein] synthase II
MPAMAAQVHHGAANDVVITGIGIVTSLGEGIEANWQALNTPDVAPVIDENRFAPFTVHPLPEIDWSAQIAKRGDIRQMEPWQRIGTYAAGMALEDAGIKGDDALTATMDMIVAAGGGERDASVDAMILDAALTRNDRGVLLNEKLTTELRPTLFLAQLSNLLAGNISIVHKVTGSSRTFMGEESSGISALETAVARIRAGTSSHLLVGASYNAEHPDMLLGLEVFPGLHRGGWKPLNERITDDRSGMITGSGGVFFVLESREHAERRGRNAYARIEAIHSARAARSRNPEALGESLAALLTTASTVDAVISAPSGAAQPTQVERDLLASHGTNCAEITSTLGFLREAQFPAAVALAALALSKGAMPKGLSGFPNHDPAADIQRIAALTTGFLAGEGIVLLAKA